MLYKRLAGAVLALAIAGLGALMLASPVQATGGEHYPAAGWQVRQIGLGETAWSTATASEVVDATTVALTKPDPTTGTSIETTDLGLPVTAETVITVDYTLDGDADTTLGAVRMFYYDSADADTLTVGPTDSVAADGSGTLSLTVDADATIGTFGLVYDASNATAGTVTFSGLTVGKTAVRFTPPEPVFSTDCEAYVNSAGWCEEVEVVDGLHDVDRYNCPDAAKGPYASPNVKLVNPDVDPFGLDGLPGPPTTGEPGVGCEDASPSPEVSESPAPGIAGGMDDAGGQLPVTGSPLPWIAVGGVALIGIGSALFAVSRAGRRPTFTA